MVLDEYDIKPTPVTEIKHKKMIIWAKEYILNPRNNDKIVSEIKDYLREYILDTEITDEYDIIISEVITIRKKLEKEEREKKIIQDKIKEEE
jgi:hypothetical protein